MFSPLLPRTGGVEALHFPLCRGMWRSQVHPCLSWGSLSWWYPLCSCGPSAGPQFSYWSKAKAVRARQSHLSQQSCPRRPSSMCRFVARCTRWGSCPLGKHHHSSRRSPLVVVRHGIFLQHWLSLTQNDQKSKSVPQNLPLFTLLRVTCREEKEGRNIRRKMEKKVVNVTEPWKAWPGVEMIRYTRFFSAVAAGINITYISPSLVQEISSPGTYNLNTNCTVIQACTHTHSHWVRFRPFQVPHVHTHTFTRGQKRVWIVFFFSVCRHDSSCSYLFTHTEFGCLLSDGFVSTTAHKYSLHYAVLW